MLFQRNRPCIRKSKASYPAMFTIKFGTWPSVCASIVPWNAFLFTKSIVLPLRKFKSVQIIRICADRDLLGHLLNLDNRFEQYCDCPLERIAPWSEDPLRNRRTPGKSLCSPCLRSRRTAASTTPKRNARMAHSSREFQSLCLYDTRSYGLLHIGSFIFAQLRIGRTLAAHPPHLASSLQCQCQLPQSAASQPLSARNNVRQHHPE